MSVSDKGVSTEDLCLNEKQENTVMGVLRLEAILNTLVENKVEALKNEKRHHMVHSSPKTFFKLMRSSKTALKIEDETKGDSKRKDKLKNYCPGESKQFKKHVLRQETSVSSPDSQPYQYQKKSTEGSSVSDDERMRSTGVAHFENICIDSSCHSLPERTLDCRCNRKPNTQHKTHFGEEYISLKIEGYDIETDAMIAEEALRRAKRKRRKRRKRRMKKRLALNSHLVDTIHEHERFKHLNEDDLPPRAKWTIVATACLLLFMCLLLVGITLRMAPIIDEIVREENEKLIHSITNARNLSSNSVQNNLT